MADDALLVSTDDGAIHGFRPGSEKAAGRQHAQQEIPLPWSKPLAVPQLAMTELALEPYLEFTGPTAAVVRSGDANHDQRSSNFARRRASAAGGSGSQDSA